MKLKLTVIAMAIAMSSPAWAANEPVCVANGNGNVDCSGAVIGDQNITDNSVNNTATGGTATAGAGVFGSGNSANDLVNRTDVNNRNVNDVRNTNRNLNAQGQLQGQMQGQIGINRQGDQTLTGTQSMDGNLSGNTLTVSPVANGGLGGAGGNVTTNPVGNGLVVVGDYVAEGGSRAGDAPDDNSVNVITNHAAQARNPVATAYAAPLTSSNDTCMGSTSAGGQGITFGISLATTWRDKDCVVRKDARFLHNAGHQDISLSLMCEKDSVKAAVKRAGTPTQKVLCGIEEEK